MKKVPTTGSAAAAALRSFAVDRTSPVPLYFQVSQHLENAIADGTIPPGTLFENEIGLAEQLGVSRPTMRRAMQHLVEQGLIVRRRGVGTRVVQPTVRRPLRLSSLYDDLAGSGQRPTTMVLSFDPVDAGEEVAARLHVAQGTAVRRIVRLRGAGGTALAKMTNYLREDLVTFTADDLADHGLYALLRAAGVQLHSAAQTVGARTATAAEARVLEEPRGSALLTMQRTSYDDRGRVVEFGDHLYAASRYSFEVNLLQL